MTHQESHCIKNAITTFNIVQDRAANQDATGPEGDVWHDFIAVLFFIAVARLGKFNYYFQTEYSQEEHAAIQTVLRQKLGPGFISQRAGAGGQRVRSAIVFCITLFTRNLNIKSGYILLLRGLFILMLLPFVNICS